MAERKFNYIERVRTLTESLPIIHTFGGGEGVDSRVHAVYDDQMCEDGTGINLVDEQGAPLVDVARRLYFMTLLAVVLLRQVESYERDR